MPGVWINSPYEKDFNSISLVISYNTILISGWSNYTKFQPYMGRK